MFVFPRITGCIGTVVMLIETCIAAITKITRALTGIESRASGCQQENTGTFRGVDPITAVYFWAYDCEKWSITPLCISVCQGLKGQARDLFLLSPHDAWTSRHPLSTSSAFSEWSSLEAPLPGHRS